MGNIVIQALGILLLVIACTALFRKRDKMVPVILLVLGIIFLADGIISTLFFGK
ncbi:MAG: hypothetical protein ABF586_11245 [Sporolactobacillus sp.]